MADLLKELSEALAAGGVDEVPEGFLTSDQYAAGSGSSIVRANRLLRAGIAAGLVEQRFFRIRTPSGIVRPIPHYRRLP